MRRWPRVHPLLSVALASYLALSALELGRVLLVERSESDIGLYTLERATEPHAGRNRPAFRWTRDEAHVLRRVRGRVLRVPLLMTGRPDVPPARVPVDLRLGDVSLGRLAIARPGWTELAYFLPPILGREKWAEVLASRKESREVRPRLLPFWQELRPWQREPGAPLVWLHVGASDTFVPARLSESRDERRLGVGLGRLRWEKTLPEGGLGFHEWEADRKEVAFRWTNRWASQPLDVEGDRLWFWIRAAHPGIDGRPVAVDVFWNATARRSIVLATHDWHRVDMTIPSLTVSSSRDGVLTLHVDRTWSPAEETGHDDSRELGVAVTTIRWPRRTEG